MQYPAARCQFIFDKRGLAAGRGGLCTEQRLPTLLEEATKIQNDEANASAAKGRRCPPSEAGALVTGAHACSMRRCVRRRLGVYASTSQAAFAMTGHMVGTVSYCFGLG